MPAACMHSASARAACAHLSALLRGEQLLREARAHGKEDLWNILGREVLQQEAEDAREVGGARRRDRARDELDDVRLVRAVEVQRREGLEHGRGEL